ncbi:MAG: Ig-like domain-containing protein [Lachnospiraceae bacterium]
MRKKFLVLGLAAIVGASSVPVTNILTNTSEVMAAQKDEDDWDDEDEDWDDEDDDFTEIGYELTKGYVVASPAKKTIKVGKTFTIDLYPSDDFEKEYGDLPDEEWDELIEENIDNITFRSSKSSVAMVNSKGKVKGKKKGSAIIKTTVTFRDGSEGTYKTKVYVTR